MKEFESGIIMGIAIFPGERPSLAYFDPTLESETVEPFTVRPFPLVDINDLTKISPNNRVLPLAIRGSHSQSGYGI